jgi:iduronate 2-sulfatase
MKMRARSLWPAVLFTIGACLLGAPIAGGQPARRPNVIFIAVDDLRNDLGCYGHPQAQTPNIDRLARRGVRFDRAYCQYPVCNPSRASLLTGLRPDRTGVLDNNTNFRTKLPRVVTLPQLFRRHGYFTASLGKIFHRGLTMEDSRAEMDDQLSWDVAHYFQATARGNIGEGRNLTGGRLEWCRWLAAEGDDEDQPDGQIAREAIKLLEQRGDQPFFLAIGFHKPHDPFNAPKKYFDLYPLDKLELPRDAAERSPELPAALPGGSFRAAFAHFTDQERREFMRAYYAGVSFTDAQVGKVLDALDRLKLADSTIIIFFGDHGYHLGERGWWNKNTLFERSCRAPCIVVAPGAKHGQACRALVEFIDIYPTLAELSRLPAPARLQGRSFVPLLNAPQRAWKRAAFTQVQRGKTAGRSARTEHWRYTEWRDERGALIGTELYDHRDDPHEWRNLANDARYAAVRKGLAALLPKANAATDR